MRIGSLFSGYGGLDMAVEQVFGATTAWVSDIDKGARKILAHRYPDVPNLGDITSIDWAAVEPVDIITGGSPCQDLSNAGKRSGMTEGTRSNLWVAMREAIAQLKPSIVVWENVRGAYSATADSDLEPCAGCMGDPADRGPVLRALGRVLGDLSDLGYDTQWHGLRAADVGACHARFRVFVLAYPRGGGGIKAIQHDGRRAAAGDRASVPDQRDREPLRPGPDGGLTLLHTPAAANPNDGEPVETWEARRQRTKDRVGNGNGFGTPLSIAVQLLPTPRTTDAKGMGPADLNRDTVQLRAVSALLPTPTTQEAQSGPSQATRNTPPLNAQVLMPDRWGDYAAAIASHERLTGRPAPSPTEPGTKGKPRLSVRFVEWMMGLPDGWITDVPGITRNEALKACGNGVVPQQAAAAISHMVERVALAEAFQSLQAGTVTVGEMLGGKCETH